MRKVFILLVIFGLVLVSSCTEEPKTLTSAAVICNKPYIKVGASCCLDQNDNSICDKDERLNEKEKGLVDITGNIVREKGKEEAEQKPKCSNECLSDSCSGFGYIACLQKSDGCKYKENKGNVFGKCGVECFGDSNCKKTMECKNHKCVEKKKKKIEQKEQQEARVCDPTNCDKNDKYECIGTTKWIYDYYCFLDKLCTYDLDIEYDSIDCGYEKPEEEKEQEVPGLETIIVTYVVDGDTIELNNEEKVRLICVDTPEVGEGYSSEATNYLKSLVLNKEVQLVKDVSETDRYGRLLRYVYVGDVFVNGKLVENGYARVYRYPPDIKLCDELEVLETKAKNNNLGIWSEVEGEETTDSKYICNYNAYNCGDFSTHAQAQAVYEACGGVSNDIHQLDRDKDGLACESLP